MCSISARSAGWDTVWRTRNNRGKKKGKNTGTFTCGSVSIMQKKSLKWFLIKNFLIVLLGIYIAKSALDILYRQTLLPFLTDQFQMQQISVTGSGSFFFSMAQIVLLYLISFLPAGISDPLSRLIAGHANGGIQLQVSSPLYSGWQNSLLVLFVLFLLLFLLGLSLLPYAVGALWYYRKVSRKVKQLLQEEKEQQLFYERKRSLLLSDIAHDIKTPITTICGYSRALSEGAAPAEKRAGYLNAIYEKALRIDELISLLFEYVKLDSEGYVLHREQGNLAELLRETAAAFYTDFEERQMQLTVDIPEEPVPFEMDSLQIKRAVTNLLTNALRYGKDGGNVFIQLKEDTVTVADDGRAIDPVFAERIFEPFSREDSVRMAKGGSGLGLSIAAKIIEMHGGTISLNTGFGDGYTKAFQIRLPLET